MPVTTIRGGRQISDGTIPYADIQNVTANTILGNNTGSATTIQEIALATSSLLGRGASGNISAITLGSGLSFSGTSIVLTTTPVGGSGTLNYVAKFTPNGTTVGNSQIFDDGTNVGIGTTSPSHKLHVAGDGYNFRTSNAANSYGYNIGRNIGDGLLYFYGDQTGYTGYVFGGIDGTKMCINTLGNVGIGTASPNYPLEISSTAILSIAYQRTGVSAKKWGFDSDNTATYWYNITDNVRSFTLTNDGKVGIGTTSPSTKLDVNGYATIRSGVILDGAASTYKEIIFNAGGFNRWDLYVIGDETGSNAGSDLYLARYADNGSYLANVLFISRATGAITFNSSVTASSFVKSGGTSSQFLKADGSVASTAYTANTGTVTSVALAAGTTGTDVNISGSPVTTSGTLTINIPDASATARGLVTTGNQTFAGNKTFSSAFGANFKALVLEQSGGVTPATGGLSIYNDTNNNLSISKSVASNVAVFSFSNSATRTYTLQNASGTLAFLSDIPVSTGGTVTSVSGTGTVSGISLSGTVTTSGNLTLSGTLSVLPSNFSAYPANTVFAGPTSGGSATPSFRGLVAADIPALPYLTSYTETDTLATVTGRGASTTTQVSFNREATINTTTPGTTATYGLHFGGQATADSATGITFSAGQAAAGNANAGIYVQGSGSYGTRMYIATTDSYAQGAKTAVSINESGIVNFVRNRPTALGNTIWDAGNLTNLNQLTNGPGYITAAQTYYVGTTQNALNRSSAVQTLTGVSIDGNAATANRLTSVSISNVSTDRSAGNLEYYDVNGATGAPASGWHSYISVRHGNASNQYGFQFANSFGTETLYWRGWDGTNPLTWRTVWHSGNLTNLNQLTNGPGYITGNQTITLTGDVTGSGTTSIATTVNAYFDQRVYSRDDNYLGGYYDGAGNNKPNNTIFGAGKLKIAMLNSSNLGFGGSWNDVLWISTYTGSDVKSSHALVFDKYSSDVWVADQNYDSATWGTGYKLWHSGNLTPGNYLPLAGGTLTGGLTISNGADLNLRAATSSTDSGDLVFQDGAGTELHRLWNGTNTLNYRTNGGTTYQMWHSGNLTNLNQLTNGPGYITAAQTYYIGTTQNALNRASAAQSLTGITSIDGYANNIRSGTITNLNTAWTDLGSSIANGLQIFRYDSNATNNPESLDNANWLMNIYSHPSGGTASYGHQIAGVDSNNIYVRMVSNGSFGSWYKIWTAATLTNLNQLTNGPGYITGYSETDTLATVVARGNTTGGSRPITLSNTDGAIFIKGDSGGWAMATYFLGSAGTNFGGFGALGSANTFSYLWIGAAYNDPWLTLTSTQTRVYGSLGIGVSPGHKLDVLGRSRFRSDGTDSAGFWMTNSSGTNDVFVGQTGVNSTDPWGVWSNSAWRLTVANSGKTTIYSDDDAPLKVQGSNTWTGIHFTDSGGTDYMWVWGATGTFSIGGGGSTVSGKKLHIHGGVTIGTSLSASSVSTNGLAVEGDITAKSDIYLTNLSSPNTSTLRFGDNTGWVFRMQTNVSGTYTTRFSFQDNGTFTAVGDVIAYSDARVKTNIATITDPLEKVTKLRGVTYNRTDSTDTSEKVGVIAQEVEQVLPQVVTKNADGVLGVAYGNMVGLLIEAVKEQQSQIESLKKQIEYLVENSK